ncbi:MAG: CRTAC1 family protein, partial [Phycisphaerae bacterium]
DRGVAGELGFAEITTEAGVAVVHSSSGYANSIYTGGGAVGDFNRDGFQDLFVISGGDGHALDRLFINNGDGTFTDQATAWELTASHKGKGAAVGDFNGDGWLDIYETSAGPSSGAAPGHHKLYRNNGDGTFTNVAASAGVRFTHPTVQDGWGAAFGDYDRDGDLDLFVAGTTSNNAGSRIFRNNGDETFTDMTEEIGFFAGTPFGMFSFTPRFVDMDGDWYPEMLLVSDFGTSRYFRNNTDGTFTDITGPSNTSQEENGMGQTLGDFNGDGLIDWYVTSIDNGSFWTGNKLYLNQGNHQYQEVAESLGIEDGGYGWGALGVDFNHDGLLDVAETNGGLGPQYTNEQSYLWLQTTSGAWDEVAVETGFRHFGYGRGMVRFDLENDGDQDVLIFANNEPITLYRNDLDGLDTHWLRVFLVTAGEPALPPNGYGARVTVTVGKRTQLRTINSGANFLSHSEISAHFGLGLATVVDALRVDWPNGETTMLHDVAADRTLTVAYVPGAFGDLDT